MPRFTILLGLNSPQGLAQIDDLDRRLIVWRWLGVESYSRAVKISCLRVL